MLTSTNTIWIEEPRAKRLTREQSKAQTRARLIEVGRRHIVRDGLGNAVAERIAEDAGYSRGAFYSNFADKEELLLAVIQEDQERRLTRFRSILESKQEPAAILKEFREALAERITDPAWIVLQAEFQAGALRSERLRQSYIEIHRLLLRDGRNILNGLSKSSGIHFRLSADEFLLTMLNVAHGLAVNQRILGEDLSVSDTRKLIYSVFDQFVS